MVCQWIIISRYFTDIVFVCLSVCILSHHVRKNGFESLQTAYFVIPENVKHGEELICSYFACRNAGIKFRYCSHCKVPVAKRNFRKRHKHGGEIIGDKGDDSGDDETPKKGIPSQITASRDEEEDEDGISSQSADSTNHGGIESKQAPVPKVALAQSSMIAPGIANVKEVFDHGVVPKSNGKISDERLSHWVSLLAKRPSTKDSDTMSAWLMEVLAVSDLETPLQVSTSTPDITDDHNEDSDVKKRTMEDEVISKDKYIEEKVRNVDNTTENVDGSAIKKKRPSEWLETGQENGETKQESNGGMTERDTSSSAFASGSFAEWKERKKQKMQSKGLMAP